MLFNVLVNINYINCPGFLTETLSWYVTEHVWININTWRVNTYEVDNANDDTSIYLATMKEKRVFTAYEYF